MIRILLLLVLLPLLASCDMSEQPRADSYGKSALFADGKVMQTPPEGTMARGDPAMSQALAQRPPMALSLLQRGRDRYAINCVPCHDLTGSGHGVVPSRGYPSPPDFHSANMRHISPEKIVQAITQGYGVMYSYANRVPPADRWAIAAYLKALQLAGDAPVSVLTSKERARLKDAEK